MAKFSSEEKTQAVRQYLNGNEGGKITGEDAFRKRYTSYPVQFKLGTDFLIWLVKLKHRSIRKL